VLRGARRGRVGGTAFRVDGARVGEREEALGRSGGGAGRGQGRAGGQSVGGGASSVVPVMALLSNGGRGKVLVGAGGVLPAGATFYLQSLLVRKVPFGTEGFVRCGRWSWGRGSPPVPARQRRIPWPSGRGGCSRAIPVSAARSRSRGSPPVLGFSDYGAGRYRKNGPLRGSQRFPPASGRREGTGPCGAG
jgi:hypothetical protein